MVLISAAHECSLYYRFVDRTFKAQHWTLYGVSWNQKSMFGEVKMLSCAWYAQISRRHRVQLTYAAKYAALLGGLKLMTAGRRQLECIQQLLMVGCAVANGTQFGSDTSNELGGSYDIIHVLNSTKGEVGSGRSFISPTSSFDMTDEISQVSLGMRRLLNDPTSLVDPTEKASKADELNLRGDRFLEMFGKTGNDEDVCQAIKAYKQAASSLSENDPRLGGFLNDVAIGYGARYKRFGRLDDLEEAISTRQKLVATTAEEDANFVGWLNNLGVLFSERFKHTGDMQNISEAIQYQQHAVQLTPEGHFNLPAMLNNLGNSFLRHFECTEDMQSISQAIQYQQHAVQLTPEEHADLPGRLSNLGSSFLYQFKCTGYMQDILEAIQYQQQAIKLTPEGHASLPGRLNNLGNAFLCCFKHTGNIQDISEAIQHQQHAVQLTPEEHADLPVRLNNLGTSLLCHFEHTGDINDILKAMQYQQHAVQLTPEGHADLPARLNNLGSSFLRCFEQTGNIQDILEAIKYQQHAIQLTPEKHAGLPGQLNNLGSSFSCCFQHTGNIQDISKAIQYQQHAIQLTPEGHADLPMWLMNLGTSFLCRFEHTGDMQDISKAIQYQQHAVQLTPKEHTNLPVLLSNLGNSFSNRFKHTGNGEDISEAIQLHQHAVQLIPKGHTAFPQCLINLGNSFSSHFEYTGNLQDISEAIKHQQHAVQLTPKGHADLAGWLNNLGNSFLYRFEHTGIIQDILEAIQYQQNAVQLTPEGHADLPGQLNSLGNSFLYHFKCTKNMNDISEAIKHQQHAIQLTPQGHANLPIWLNNLGSSYSEHFEHTKNMHDILEAIQYQQHAVKLTPEGHPDLPVWLNSLGISFLHCFEHTKNMQDILQAIQYQQYAIQLTPEGHADLPLWLDNLGSSFWHCFKHTKVYEFLSLAILNVRLSARCSTGPTSVRLTAAKKWATFSKKLISPPLDLLQSHACIIQLLSLISGLENTIQHRHETLVDTSQLSLAASAAALCLGQSDKALEWLVQGRCIVWNQIDQLRTPLDKLHSYNPALAKQFSILSKKLENAGLHTNSYSKKTELSMDVKISLENQARMHLKYAKEWEQLLGVIRNISQFEYFLKPRKCTDIMSTISKEGPIVLINIHSDHCDALALIAGANKPLHIPLPNFSYKKAKYLADSLHNYLFSFGVRLRLGMPFNDTCNSSLSKVDFPVILKVLWSDIVSPILEALGFFILNSDKLLPRIWWCPTGPLTFLPIHAAGIYDQGKGISGKCLSEFAVSSYIPNVSIHDMSNSVKNCHNPPTGMLMISQSNTPGKSKIPLARDEVEKIEKQLEILKIPSYTLNDKKATINHVLESMDKFSCIHLACHASQHMEIPLKSSIHLHDGPLKLSEIMKINLQNPDFAFLSACQTGKGSKKLSEEAVHLASGMLAAGYQSVVGTMWSVFDEHSPDIAEFFYKNLLKDQKEPKIEGSQAARALHAATKQLQKKAFANSENSFLVWVPYIHFGM